MPIGAMLQSQMFIGVLTETINSESDKYQSWSYTGVVPIPCRFYELAARNVQQGFGQELQVDAEAIIAGYQSLGPLTTGADTGKRWQVKIINRQGVTSFWEVIKVSDLGGMGRLKKVQLKKFV